MPRICIIDDREDLPAPPFLQDAFEELGHSTCTIFVHGRNPVELRNLLEKVEVDLFVAIQTVGFLAGQALSSPAFASKKIAVLFYDDPISTVQLFGKRHPFFTSSKNVFFFVWDGYWLRELQRDTGVPCFPTHLAAETKHFSPGRQDLIPQVRNSVVFLGNIPSETALHKLESELASPWQKVALEVKSLIARGPYALNPFATLETCLRSLFPEEAGQIHDDMGRYMESTPDFSKPLAPHVQLRRLVWQYGKRETRLRALRAAAQSVPLSILSNLKDVMSAGEDELRAALNSRGQNSLLFVDTSQASYYQLAHLYQAGRFHLQSTDPQSVEGGIPYRVFQSAACATPLVSDSKKELRECFESEKEMSFYNTDADLPAILQKAWNEPDRLRSMGEAAHQRFLREHTWTHRMRHLLRCLSE